MSLRWIRETPPTWDADKRRIVGGAVQGAFDASLVDRPEGSLVPGDWWRVEHEGQTVGYGWMDISWGDAEILLAVAPDAQRHGVGSFILERLEREAAALGVNYLYNQLLPTHPQHDEVRDWLAARRFRQSEDGRLRRTIVFSAQTAHG